MRGAILYAPGDVRCEDRPDPAIVDPADAVVRTVASCVCRSDLWPYRGIEEVTQAHAMGHEFCGIVEQVGDAVTSVQPGRFVVGGFRASCNTCRLCRAGMQYNSPDGGGYDGCQSELIRIPLADGNLVDRVWNRREPGKVFDFEQPFDQVAEAYRAMDDRRAIKVLLRP